MKIDGLDWMDWLHEQRRAAEADRKRRGLSGAEYLRECAREAARVKDELASRRQLTVSDKPATKPHRLRTRKPCASDHPARPLNADYRVLFAPTLMIRPVRPLIDNRPLPVMLNSPVITDGLEWLDWLHNMRAKEEEKRMREGISGAEWLRRVSAHAQEVLDGLPEHAPIARDKPATKPPRPRTRRP